MTPRPPIDKLAWLPLCDRRALFVRAHGNQLFYTVGGKREPGESNVEALHREVWEEVRCRLDYGSESFLATFTGPAHGHPPGTLVTNQAYLATTADEPQPASEIAELAWLSSADLHRTTPLGHQILRFLAAHGYID